MTFKVQYQTTRENCSPITEQWSINGQGWIIRPQGKYFVLPQYVRGIIEVLITGRIITCLPLINSEKLYDVKRVPSRSFVRV